MIDVDIGHLHHFLTFSPCSSFQQSHSILCQNIIVKVCFGVSNIFKALLICSFIIPVIIFRSSFHTMPLVIWFPSPCFILKIICSYSFYSIVDEIFEEHRVMGRVLWQSMRLAFTLASVH